MNRRNIVAGLVAAAVVGAGVWYFGFRTDSTSAAPMPSASANSAVAPTLEIPAAQASAFSQPAGAGGLWVRPTPKVAARHSRREGIAWIYRQFGASDRLLDRMVDGDLVGALRELKAKAAAGDPSAINIYGHFVYFRCATTRGIKVPNEYTESEIQGARVLPTADAEWFRDAFMEDIAFEQSIEAACTEVVDVDQAFALVAAEAEQGDAASLWLKSMTSRNWIESPQRMLELQQLVRDGAAAGFPQAQLELAWDILAGRAGAAGTGADEMNASDLLRQSAEHLPQAKATLASCEWSGCPGIAVDPAAAVSDALDAAEHGSIEALISMGPHLMPSQFDPTDIETWTLMKASLELQGCVGIGFSVRAMKETLGALSSPAATPAAKRRADQLWAQYGGQIQAALGCNG